MSSATRSTSVRIVFLGGLGEIGRNCFCLEVEDRIIVVDCGLMFPDAGMPGVDLVLPDFTYLRNNAERVEGIVLTHGHEDHIGALAYLLQDVSAPIYGSALSLGFARKRITEAGMLDRTELIPVSDGEVRRIGSIDCEFVPVTHSVPHAFAVAYHTPIGTVLHTGDFKFDLTPVDGRTTDLSRLGAIGLAGVRLLLSDSTNAEEEGSTPSESTVGPVIRGLLRDHPRRRFIVAAFSSHLHRVEQVAREAVAAGRKVAFLGRSMVHNVTLAREMGLLDLPVASIIDIEEASRYAPGEVCVVCTGSQGEPMSALALMAAHEHKHVKVSEDDVVVISACFSGVFVPALAKSNRMVLTAARPDRTSFGCGQDNKYPYFDDCFLSSMPQARDFGGLSGAVRECVRARETAERMTPPSEPQVFVGGELRPMLPLYAFEAPGTARKP